MDRVDIEADLFDDKIDNGVHIIPDEVQLMAEADEKL